MIYLTIINAFPVKQRMKNAFLENHIFTEYNLFMNHDLGSGGNVGLQISDLDAIRFLLQNIIGDVKSGLISIIYYGCRLNYLDTS